MKSVNKFYLLFSALFTVFAAGLYISLISGTTQAYFTDRKTLNFSPMQSAVYEIDICCTNEDFKSLDAVKNDNLYTLSLEENKQYEIVLTNSGTAHSGTCLIDFEGETYSICHSVQNTVVSFTVNSSKASTLTVKTVWGTSAEDNVLQNGDIIGNTHS